MTAVATRDGGSQRSRNLGSDRCPPSAATTGSSPTARSAPRARCSTRAGRRRGEAAPRGRAAPRQPRQAATRRARSRGPFVAAGPYDGAEIRLERVPGGLRLAAWRGGQIERAAPVLAAPPTCPALLAEAADEGCCALAGASRRPTRRPSRGHRRRQRRAHRGAARRAAGGAARGRPRARGALDHAPEPRLGAPGGAGDAAAAALRGGAALRRRLAPGRLRQAVRRVATMQMCLSPS